MNALFVRVLVCCCLLTGTAVVGQIAPDCLEADIAACGPEGVRLLDFEPPRQGDDGCFCIEVLNKTDQALSSVGVRLRVDCPDCYHLTLVNSSCTVAQVTNLGPSHVRVELATPLAPGESCRLSLCWTANRETCNVACEFVVHGVFVGAECESLCPPVEFDACEREGARFLPVSMGGMEQISRCFTAVNRGLVPWTDFHFELQVECPDCYRIIDVYSSHCEIETLEITPNGVDLWFKDPVMPGEHCDFTVVIRRNADCANPCPLQGIILYPTCFPLPTATFTPTATPTPRETECIPFGFTICNQPATQGTTFPPAPAGQDRVCLCIEATNFGNVPWTDFHFEFYTPNACAHCLQFFVQSSDCDLSSVVPGLNSLDVYFDSPVMPGQTCRFTICARLMPNCPVECLQHIFVRFYPTCEEIPTPTPTNTAIITPCPPVSFSDCGPNARQGVALFEWGTAPDSGCICITARNVGNTPWTDFHFELPFDCRDCVDIFLASSTCALSSVITSPGVIDVYFDTPVMPGQSCRFVLCWKRTGECDVLCPTVLIYPTCEKPPTRTPTHTPTPVETPCVNLTFHECNVPATQSIDLADGTYDMREDCICITATNTGNVPWTDFHFAFPMHCPECYDLLLLNSDCALSSLTYGPGTIDVDFLTPIPPGGSCTFVICWRFNGHNCSADCLGLNVLRLYPTCEDRPTPTLTPTATVTPCIEQRFELCNREASQTHMFEPPMTDDHGCFCYIATNIGNEPWTDFHFDFAVGCPDCFTFTLVDSTCDIATVVNGPASMDIYFNTPVLPGQSCRFIICYERSPNCTNTNCIPFHGFRAYPTCENRPTPTPTSTSTPIETPCDQLHFRDCGPNVVQSVPWNPPRMEREGCLCLEAFNHGPLEWTDFHFEFNVHCPDCYTFYLVSSDCDVSFVVPFPGGLDIYFNTPVPVGGSCKFIICWRFNPACLDHPDCLGIGGYRAYPTCDEIVTPTATFTKIPEPTDTPTATATETREPTSTETPTPRPTQTFTNTPIETPCDTLEFFDCNLPAVQSVAWHHPNTALEGCFCLEAWNIPDPTGAGNVWTDFHFDFAVNCPDCYTFWLQSTDCDVAYSVSGPGTLDIYFNTPVLPGQNCTFEVCWRVNPNCYNLPNCVGFHGYRAYPTCDELVTPTPRPTDTPTVTPVETPCEPMEFVLCGPQAAQPLLVTQPGAIPATQGCFCITAYNAGNTPWTDFHFDFYTPCPDCYTFWVQSSSCPLDSWTYSPTQLDLYFDPVVMPGESCDIVVCWRFNPQCSQDCLGPIYARVYPTCDELPTPTFTPTPIVTPCDRYEFDLCGRDALIPVTLFDPATGAIPSHDCICLTVHNTGDVPWTDFHFELPTDCAQCVGLFLSSSSCPISSVVTGPGTLDIYFSTPVMPGQSCDFVICWQRIAPCTVVCPTMFMYPTCEDLVPTRTPTITPTPTKTPCIEMEFALCNQQATQMIEFPAGMFDPRADCFCLTVHNVGDTPWTDFHFDFLVNCPDCYTFYVNASTCPLASVSQSGGSLDMIFATPVMPGQSCTFEICWRFRPNCPQSCLGVGGFRAYPTCEEHPTPTFTPTPSVTPCHELWFQECDREATQYVQFDPPLMNTDGCFCLVAHNRGTEPWTDFHFDFAVSCPDCFDFYLDDTTCDVASVVVGPGTLDIFFNTPVLPGQSCRFIVCWRIKPECLGTTCTWFGGFRAYPTCETRPTPTPTYTATPIVTPCDQFHFDLCGPQGAQSVVFDPPRMETEGCFCIEAMNHGQEDWTDFHFDFNVNCPDCYDFYLVSSNCDVLTVVTGPGTMDIFFSTPVPPGQGCRFIICWRFNPSCSAADCLGFGGYRAYPTCDGIITPTPTSTMEPEPTLTPTHTPTNTPPVVTVVPTLIYVDCGPIDVPFDPPLGEPHGCFEVEVVNEHDFARWSGFHFTMHPHCEACFSYTVESLCSLHDVEIDGDDIHVWFDKPLAPGERCRFRVCWQFDEVNCPCDGIPQILGLTAGPVCKRCWVWGDLNDDDIAGTVDASLILRYDAFLIDQFPCCPETFPDFPERGDLNGDGILGTVDASLLLQYDAFLIDCFHAVDLNCDGVGPEGVDCSNEYP